jgi:hypothetical protein
VAVSVVAVIWLIIGVVVEHKVLVSQVVILLPTPFMIWAEIRRNRKIALAQGEQGPE